MGDGIKKTGEGGSPTQSGREPESKPVGKSDAQHEFTDKTQTERHIEDHVPHQKIYQGGTFEHKFEIAKRMGAIYVIQLLVSYILPFVSAPKLNEDVANVDRDTELMKLLQAGKKYEDSKVQGILNEMFPNVKKLTNNLEKNKSDPQSRLEEIEGQLRASEKRDVGEHPFVTQKRNEVVAELKTLRDAVVTHILGDPKSEWKGLFEGFKKFPIHQDPVAFFNFHSELGKQIEQLRAVKDTTKSPTLQEALKQQIEGLEKLQGEVKQELARQLELYKAEIDQKMPLKKLQDAAKQAGVVLPEGKSFAEQVKVFNDYVQKQIDTLSASLRQAHARDEEDKKTLKDRTRELEGYQFDLKKLLADQESKTTEVSEQGGKQVVSNRSRLTKETADLQVGIGELERKEKGLLAIQRGEVTERDVKKGKLTEGFKVKVSLTEEQTKELAALQERLATDRKSLTNKSEELRNLDESATKAEEKALKQLSGDYSERIQTKRNQIENAERDIAGINKKLKEPTTDYGTQMNRFQDVKSKWNDTLEKDTMGMTDLCKQFVRLSLYQSAFQQYPTTEAGKDPMPFIAGHLRDTRAPFEGQMRSSLEAMGLPPTSSAYKAGIKEIDMALVRKRASEGAELGLARFQ